MREILFLKYASNLFNSKIVTTERFLNPLASYIKMEFHYKDHELCTNLVEELRKKFPDCEKRYKFLGKCLVVASYSRMLEDQKDGRYYFGNTSVTSKALEARDLSRIIKEAMKNEEILDKKLKQITWKNYKTHQNTDRIFGIILNLYFKKERYDFGPIGEAVERALTQKSLKDLEETKLNFKATFKEDLPVLRDEAKAKCFFEEESRIRGMLIKYLL